MINLSDRRASEGSPPRHSSPGLRRNLLIVRAGDTSLHKHWLNGDNRLRNFDLHVSYFGDRDISEIVQGLDITATAEKGAKFPGLVECLSKLGSRVSQYDYIGFPDDDLYAAGQTWNRFFEIVAELRPALAQPALHRSSFYSYPGLLQVPRFLARWTNFVEVMTPVFSSTSLARALPLFSENRSGWGMDSLWPELFQAQDHTLCVVDQTPILHTRAVRSGPLYSVLGKTGNDPMDELNAFLSKQGVERSPFKVYAAISKNGLLIEGKDFSSRNVVPRLRNKIRRRLSITEISASNWLHML
jgi:hypothetical protein